MTTNKQKTLNPVKFRVLEKTTQESVFEAVVPEDVLVKGKEAIESWLRGNGDTWEPVHVVDITVDSVDEDSVRLLDG